MTIYLKDGSMENCLSDEHKAFREKKGVLMMSEKRKDNKGRVCPPQWCQMHNRDRVKKWLKQRLLPACDH